ncbi:uncharacterized protein LOC133803834 [Humulus lupulus]|uniref:uncharacterized protein LOC133803834 n=1 Tax=Humulus lupulus TaxID=3486 RepID=UPI002B404DE6|nr:uncharacterized protein LOC133803834 [Humulus lupulus]
MALLAVDLLAQVGMTMSTLQLKQFATLASQDAMFVSQAIRHQAIADALLAHRNATLMAEMAMKLEMAQMELEGDVNQREAAKEALAREAARIKANREEASRIQAQHEEALSRKDADHKKLVDNLEAELLCVRSSEALIKALLEATKAQIRQEREKVANLESWNQALDGMVQLEMKRSEEAC